MAKTAQVYDALVACATEGTPLRAQLDELHRRGAFRHDHDVAYAAITLAHGRRTVDDLVIYLTSDYAGIDCDPVVPPS